jgi:uncharacterized membrane protein HdeD (DUF308 family)
MAESAASKRGTVKRSSSTTKKSAGAKKSASAAKGSTTRKSTGATKASTAKKSASAAPKRRSAASKAAAEKQAIKGFSKFWWLWLLFGLVWIALSVVILQFDQASITTVGIIIGAMFLGAAVQNFALAGLEERGKWVFGIFGVLFLAASVIAFISPENTFAAVADVLGFLFLLVGVFWVIEAFMAREVNPLWWLGLVGGILMVILAFWTGGQFFIEKAYVLLVFAGIWALMEGVINIVRAFQIRQLGRLV